MTSDSFAILIPTRNRPGILQRTLEELLQRGFGSHRLFIYDDASDDPDAITRVVGSWPGGKLIRSDIRTGQAKGRNRLMREACSEFALFLDDDSWPEANAPLAAAAAAMRQDSLTVATFQYRSLADGKLSAGVDQRRSQSSSFLGGASLFHVPSVLALGGYREAFVYGYEEPELALRLWLAERRIEYFPEVIVAHNHFERPDEKRDYREYDFLYARNGLLMSSLNMPLWFGLPHGLARSLRRSFYRKRNFTAKLAGTWAGIKMTFSHWSDREPCSWRQVRHWIKFNQQ